MGCESNSANATPPAPGIAPGAEGIDAAAVARSTTIDPRIPALVPGFDAPFFQAGLAGYSDAAMRIVARRHGCPCCVTEALLDRTLLAGGRGFAKADLGELHDNVPGGGEDHPLVGQIMGSDPDEMARATMKMVEWNERDLGEGAGFQAIDVNLACPVKKIKRKARGGHWLRDPAGAIEILRAVRDAAPERIPVTVKMRRSFDDTPEMARNFEEIFDAAYEMGCAWVTVHARTVEQKYVGPSRWTALRDIVRRRPDRVIFGSGDIWSAPEIFRMMAYTGVHAVSVARGCIGNPWIFRQARDMMAGRTPAPPTIAEQRDALEQHFRLSLAVNGEKRAGMMMRKFGVRFSVHHPHAETVRRAFIAVQSLDDWLAVLREHYDGAREPAEAVGAGFEPARP
jgi:tRNA-dihydrouridine synthase